MRLLLVLFISMSVLACKGGDDGGLKDKIEKQKETDEKAAKEAAVAKKAEEDRLRKEAEDAAAVAAAKRAAEEADRPAGNQLTTPDISEDPAVVEMLTALEKPGTFEKLAPTMKKGRAQWEPVMIKALGHKNSNVRTQVARVFVMNSWRNEAVTKGFHDALLNEDDDIIRENWGMDIRLFLNLEIDKKAEITTDLMPALHKAFKRAKSPGAMSNLAETLCIHKYKPALADIYAKLGAAEDTSSKQYLLFAMKRFPQPEMKDVVLPFQSDENKLVRLRAREVLEGIQMAEEDAGKAAGN